MQPFQKAARSLARIAPSLPSVGSPRLASVDALVGRNSALIGPLTTIYLGVIATLIAPYMVVEYVSSLG